MSQNDEIQVVLKRLKCDRYPLEVLRQDILPDGVDPTKLECYLADEDFQVSYN